VSENKKLVTTGVPTTGSSANAQPISPNQRASTNGSGKGLADPAGQGINHKVGGDFAFALVANLYHKHRESLLRLIEGMTGD
jgi:hypothetical protein